MFQSLYRGTAIATVRRPRIKDAVASGFQSLYRGTAIATTGQVRPGGIYRCFNPSIEGQPLQQSLDIGWVKVCNEKFQSLYRGTAIATTINLMRASQTRLFQSLYRGTAIATAIYGFCPDEYGEFQSLYRGTAIATEPLQRP